MEHTSLRLPHLGGFPGGLTEPFLQTVGVVNAARLLFDPVHTQAIGVTTIAYTDGRTLKAVSGEMVGGIVKVPDSASNAWEGFGWNQIFIPLGYSETLAKLGVAEKNKVSMRRVALENLVKALS